MTTNTTFLAIFNNGYKMGQFLKNVVYITLLKFNTFTNLVNLANISIHNISIHSLELKIPLSVALLSIDFCPATMAEKLNFASISSLSLFSLLH